MPQYTPGQFPLFRLSLFPANPKEVRRWRIRSGISAAASAGSVGALAAGLRHVFMPAMLNDQFIYMALAISFVTGAPLLAFPLVLCVSLAELGFATSLMYLAYSLLGVFLPGYRLILTAVTISVAIVFCVL